MNDDQTLTIGQLAKAVGVPTSSVRFYERRGLLKTVRRSPGNYRLYGGATLERLRFIRAAQVAGFTLKDIGLLLNFRDGDVSPCREVQNVIGERLAKVDREIEYLHHVRDVLGRWLKVCRKTERTGQCGVLDGLSRPDERGDAGKREKTPRRPGIPA
ncbi:MAG: heavy metal-responsive transcriptional regulator [Phycisphaerales bacterium]|jgi:Predicted transcriptional regulators|nr:heavy metal-responsive transcriptional regulator [Phycisphaerales bacterium]